MTKQKELDKIIDRIGEDIGRCNRQIDILNGNIKDIQEDKDLTEAKKKALEELLMDLCNLSEGLRENTKEK